MRKITLVLCALALTATACGDGGGGGEPARGIDALAAAADKATDAGSARMTMSMTMDAGGQEVDLEAEGQFDFAGQIGEMSVELTGAALPQAMTIDMVIEDQYVYTKLPPGLGAGSGWTRVDMSEMSGVAAGANQFSQDPSQYLEFLRGASDDVEEVGTEEIRGVETTHYRAELSFDKMLDQAPDQEAVEALRAQLGSLGDVDSIPSDVWIDEDGLPRRMSFTMSVDAQGQSFDMDVSMDLFDYGVEVDVQAPEKFEDVTAPAG